ncbi:MAG: hypothetical protein MJ178_07015 [Treponemataceae bacterium]|nr:hypothetical protein [Treponemataceae bacterium]
MVILETIVPVFLLIALGKFLKDKNFLTDAGVACLKDISINVFLPVMAFDALIHGTYSKDSIILIGCELFSLFFCFGMGFLVKRFFTGNLKGYVPYALTTWEGGLFGWALIGILVGSGNMFYIVSMDIFSGIFCFTIMTTGLRMLNGQKMSGREIALSIIKSPLIIAVILGFTGVFLGWADAIDNSVWFPLYTKVTGFFIQPLSPIILLCIGAGLTFDISILKKGLKLACVRYAVQIVCCLCVLGIIQLTMGVTWVLRTTLLMYFACPTSFLINMIGDDKETTAVTSSMLSLQILVALVVFSILAVIG